MAQTMAQSHLKIRTALVAVGRYGLAVAFVAIAVPLALVFHTFERVLLSLAIVLVTWNIGSLAANTTAMGTLLAMALAATFAFDWAWPDDASRRPSRRVP